VQITNEMREKMEENLREEAKKENGCCFYIYSWLVKWLQPFNKLGL
jgi:hypothetical protein